MLQGVLKAGEGRAREKRARSRATQHKLTLSGSVGEAPWARSNTTLAS